MSPFQPCVTSTGTISNRRRTLVTEAGLPDPELYSDGDHAFEKLMARDDLDAVIIATYWQWHTPMAVFGHETREIPGSRSSRSVNAGGVLGPSSIHRNRPGYPA